LISGYKGVTPRLGRGIFVAPNASVIGDVWIGDFSSVWFNAVLRGDVNVIRIGEYTNIQDSCVLHVATDTFPLYIGDNVTLGHGCILHGCRVGNRCLVGMGAIILDGAEIGDGCVVASGSVVLQGTKVPPRTLVAGVPASKKKDVDGAALDAIERSAAEYAELARDYLRDSEESR
jgi:carbonic anhydrase/acetyltransferase-like protein (isoleucine patch superfamily)